MELEYPRLTEYCERRRKLVADVVRGYNCTECRAKFKPLFACLLMPTRNYLSKNATSTERNPRMRANAMNAVPSFLM